MNDSKTVMHDNLVPRAIRADGPGDEVASHSVCASHKLRTLLRTRHNKTSELRTCALRYSVLSEQSETRIEF